MKVLTGYTENPEVAMDCVARSVDRFNNTGQALPPAQRAIYMELDRRVSFSVADVGCGIGLGCSILGYYHLVTGYDKEERHIAFARELYPRVVFQQWDIVTADLPVRYDSVVAVEVIEHIADYGTALLHLVRSCVKEVWVSTPNRLAPSLSKERPVNPSHVREFTVPEFLDLARECASVVEAYNWHFQPVGSDSDETPLVYRLLP